MMFVDEDVKMLTHCGCTLRVRDCGLKWCIKAIGPDGKTRADGLWICDECRLFCDEEFNRDWYD